ncbi:MAG: gamma-glutamyltransferase [Gammaproteobacteria bacterium]|jgi:gamma-glutamyltranspeptidase/glutathione hydrolase|nr:gamma-glutamyltransferase [Gammaproteobacteria bacterium]|tara:strand:+ start:15598 stop:17466 length:1869 start_codon:yes stop_codon:yes gene_type:complete
MRMIISLSTVLVATLLVFQTADARTAKPILHGKHWVAITGKPLAATAGARIFHQGGNVVDSACAMLAATSTMFDVLSWGGETQALIYNPNTGKVVGINALGVAPTGATPEFFKSRDLPYPPQYGPLAAVTPGTPGGLMVMLAEFGTMSLAEVLAPAMELAAGYPMEAQTADSIERLKEEIKKWPYSKQLFLTHSGEEREAPAMGEIFRQPDLLSTLNKLLEAEKQSLAEGADRKQAIYAAYDRFYKGDIAAEFVRSSTEMGGLHTLEDLAAWQVLIEEPVMSTYKDIEVYKLTSWVQGPVMLQALNMLEQLDMKAMGYNSARYIHTLYQVMNLSFADRDFYYGDPYFPPEEPIKGLLSKQYAKSRLRLLNHERNDPLVKPGNPYQFQKGRNPFLDLLKNWTNAPDARTGIMPPWQQASIDHDVFENDFLAGTTSIQTADKDGWVVSVTPSGGWIPAVIAGHTGIGMSQRMQSFVLETSQNPYNVVAPGKRPRATLTPGMALKEGLPYLSFAVQGGDIQDQVLVQFFLNMVEFGMNVQEAVEAANVISYQMRNSFGDHQAQVGRLLINEAIPDWVQEELLDMGYSLDVRPRTSGPINAIFFDRINGAFQGGASNFGEDYGIAW